MSDMRIGAISLAILGLACVARSQTAACAGCHREIAENYARTGMGRSFRSVGANTTLPEFDGGSFDHLASGQRFTASRRDGAYYVRRHLTGPEGNPVNSLEVRVDYVLGSGDHARSYLRRTPDNRLIEFPVSWYPENGGHWGMSPGYDRPGHQGFSREIPYRCMFCHNGYPSIESEWSGGADYPSRLPEGIDCQRCHGPGGAHIEAVRSGRPREAVRTSIVNPARLSPERRIEVCMQCHLETTSAPLPGAILKDGRGVFSYRPGEPLENYILYFDHAPGTRHDDKFEIVSSAYRLRKSACFQASNGQLGCTSCHDPHRAASREETLHKSRAVCEGCHAPAVAKLIGDGRHPAASDCASCHMPQRRAEDAIHLLITDHRISARVTPDSSIIDQREGGGLPYSGPVTLYYPEKPAPENDLYLAIAQIKELSNLPEGLRALEKALAGRKPGSARAHFELGEAFFTTGQAARALPFFEEAVKREPREWRYFYKLAQALQATSQTARAISAYQRALALAPGQSAILNALGSAYSDQGANISAATAFRQALSRDPEDALAQSNLAHLLLRAGDKSMAERALREAVRLRPELAMIRISLGATLIDIGKLADARLELEEAIKAGPSTEAARSAWFTTLAIGGSLQQAQVRYDASLRSQLAPAHANLGTALVALGDSDAAVGEYRLGITADPDSAPTLVNLALTLAARGESAEARQRLEEALRIAPDLFVAHLKLGEILLSQGQFDLATQHLRRAAESPEEPIRKDATELMRRR